MTLKELLYMNRLNNENKAAVFLHKQRGQQGEIMFDEQFRSTMDDRYERMARGQGNVGVLKKIQADKQNRA